jgi:hypothetical protein
LGAPAARVVSPAALIDSESRAVRSCFNFRFAANTRQEMVVSEQLKTCAA